MLFFALGGFLVVSGLGQSGVSVVVGILLVTLAVTSAWLTSFWRHYEVLSEQGQAVARTPGAAVSVLKWTTIVTLVVMLVGMVGFIFAGLLEAISASHTSASRSATPAGSSATQTPARKQVVHSWCKSCLTPSAARVAPGPLPERAASQAGRHESLTGRHKAFWTMIRL